MTDSVAFSQAQMSDCFIKAPQAGQKMHEILSRMNCRAQWRDALDSTVAQRFGGKPTGVTNPSHQWRHDPDGNTCLVRAKVNAAKRPEGEWKPSKDADERLRLATLIEIKTRKPKATGISHIRAAPKRFLAMHSRVRPIEALGMSTTITPTTTAVTREVKHNAALLCKASRGIGYSLDAA